MPATPFVALCLAVTFRMAQPWWGLLRAGQLLKQYTLVQVFMPATPFAALCLAAMPWTAAPADVFLAMATLLVCMSQQFHAWAHMKKSELPAAVDALQVCAHPSSRLSASFVGRTQAC